MVKFVGSANKISFKKSATVLYSMVKRGVKAQYRNSSLGVLWTVLNPLLNMVVLAIVFTNILGRNNDSGIDYPLYILSGNIVFGLMRSATSQALPCIVNNYDLLTKTRVQHYVFPTAEVISSTVNFGFSLIAMVVVMLFRLNYDVFFSWTMLLIIIFLPALMLFSWGLGLILCTIYVRFRDIKHLYTVLLTLWTYLTPLFYTVSILPDIVQKLMYFNPMYHFVQYFREVALQGIVPSFVSTVIIYGLGITFATIGLIVFHTKRRKFIYYV